MLPLDFTKLKLLSESKNLLMVLESDDWQNFSVMNQVFLEHLKVAQDEYGDQLNDLYQELLADNDQIQKKIKLMQKELFLENRHSLKNIKKLKAYSI